MKSSIKPVKVERTGAFSESKFGISSSEDLVYIFDILRNKLYSDKVIAVLREYSTNAMDAHVENGQPDRPIIVSLPTTLNPELKIRDFGEGLSEDDVRNVYCMYGRSTKRNSNDFTGQLGLGSKSGFAYGENFIITSYHGGLKTTYNAFIDETRLGSIAMINQEETSETGIEITIPISRSDIRAFSDKAERCFKYFYTTPIIRGAEIDLTRSDVVLEGKGWRHIKGSSYGYNHYGRHGDYAPVMAIMGNIGYPIKINNMNFGENESDISSLLQLNFEVEFPIGSLNISANREDLEYDKFTTVNIKRKVESIISDIRDQISNKISGSKTMSDAVRNADELLFSSQLGNVFSESKQNLSWKNIPIKSIYFGKSGKDVKFTRFYFNGSKCKREDVDKVAIKKDYVLINKDTDNGWVIRNRQYLIDNDDVSTVYLIEGNISGWCKENSLDINDDLMLLSTIEKPVVVRTKNGPSKPRDSSTAFTVSSSTARWGTQGDNWHQTSIDKTGSGIYVELFKFEIQKCACLYNANSLRGDVIPKLATLGFNEETHPIFGVKSSQCDKLGNGWVNLSDYIYNTFNKEGPLQSFLKEAVSAYSARGCRYTKKYETDVFNNDDHIKGLASCWSNKDKDHLITDFLKLDKQIRKVSADVSNKGTSLHAVYGLLEYFPKLKSICTVTDYQELANEKIGLILEQYPVLEYIHAPYGTHGRDGEAKRKEIKYYVDIKNYIETIDNCGL